MERKNFLKSLLMGAVAAPTVLAACSKDDATPATTTTGGTTNASCPVAPTETAGPFPTQVPSSYVRSDITDGRAGHPLRVQITLADSNNNCAALAGLLVDIWHCDAEGNYSEYGGSGMQATNYQAVHFLRGRQTTDSAGRVGFTTIFPGWYTGRATHIHVHVYNASGTSLKITQIAFPEGSGTALAAVDGYAKGMSGYTPNASDNVFSDDTAHVQVATVTGNTTTGFDLAITLGVTT